MKKYFAILTGLAILLNGCAGDEPCEGCDEPAAEKDVQILAPSNDAQYIIGEDCIVKIKVNHPDLISDLEFWVEDTLFAGNLELKDQDFKIETKHSRVGHIPVYIKYKDGTGKDHRDTRTIVLFSDITPEKREVEVVDNYMHDPKSYTQGLEFYEGRLYEGTGQRGQSFLAEVDLKTGAHLRKIPLDEAIFGEGITILNDTVYQISYQAGKCFVYDLNTFTKLTEFSYAGEGWGLCNNGESIIMSNGSDKVVWRDPHNFQVTKTLEVFDNQNSIAQINELELINGNLYANLYTDTRIAVIDTTTGKVLSYINCAKLSEEQPAGVDVLNGIAYNVENGKIYLTGKWWPTVYEVIFK